MSKFFRTGGSGFFIFLFLACICLVGSSYAGWKKIAQIPTGEVHCGFFFDELNGFIGTGSWDGYTNFFIRKTTDGGTTWTVCTTPIGKGFISSIFMKDPLNGYASVFIVDTVPDYSILKTTDGGNTWLDGSHGNNAYTTSVYATSKTLIRTEWYNADLGDFSADDGVSFSNISSDTDTYGNGIDFTSDMTGVMVSYGSSQTDLFPIWLTQDGGINWNRGQDSLPEAWSVYALKGTQTFVALPEGEQFNNPGQTVYLSQNGGVNWEQRAIVPAAGFTGHIAGVGNTIYVQTYFQKASGIFRSDDLGLTWKNVGGPSHQRDTRFVVTGCKGQVVYAFDNEGSIWKTTDGGDGTLLVSSAGILLALSEDSLYMETHYCQPARGYFHLTSASCDSLVIDSVTFSPDPYHEFSVDTLWGSGITLSATTFGFGIPVVFRSDSDVTRHTLIRIRAHSGIESIDTTIILVARQLLAPEPYLGDPKKTKVGDTALIPVYIRPTQDSFRIMHYAFHLTYDGDVLTPTNNPFDVLGTLSANATVQMKSQEANGALFVADFTSPITEASDLTLPLIYVRMRVTLSRNLFSAISLDTFSIAGASETLALLPMCSIPAAMFLVDPQCGDSVISEFMLSGKIAGFLSIHPNPNSGSVIEAEIYLPLDNNLTLEIINAEGKNVRKVFEGEHFTSGKHILPINTSSLASGKYILRMSSSGGGSSQQEVIILR